MPNRKKYHHGNLKETLIEAGLDILEEKGLNGLSLRALAERTGVSHTAPKNHFGNLAGLLTAIAARGFQQLADDMRRGLAENAGREERRDAAVKGYVAFAVAHPPLFELMFSKRKINSDDPDLQEPAALCFAILCDCSEGLDWDKAGEPDAELRAQMMMWSFVHGFAQLSASGSFKKDGMKALGVLDVLPRFPYRQ